MLYAAVLAYQGGGKQIHLLAEEGIIRVFGRIKGESFRSDVPHSGGWSGIKRSAPSSPGKGQTDDRLFLNARGGPISRMTVWTIVTGNAEERDNEGSSSAHFVTLCDAFA
jgi:hypothetical protein